MELAFRNHLREADLAFITSRLARSEKEAAALLRLLADPSTVDAVLDLPELLEIVLDSCHPLQIGSRLYFYLLTRHALKEAAIDDPELADYISGVLDAYTRQSRHITADHPVFYVVDWVKQVEASPPTRRFELFVEAGNQLLFLTGVFPHYLEKRRRKRGAPDIPFYESIGRDSFQSAADHPMSRRLHAECLFNHLSERFSALRQALNDVSERLVSLEPDPPDPLTSFARN